MGSDLNALRRAACSQYKSDTNWWLLKSSLGNQDNSAPGIRDGDGRRLLAHVSGDVSHCDTTKLTRTGRSCSRLCSSWRWSYSAVSRIQHLHHPGNNDNDCGNYSVEAKGTFCTTPVR